MSLLAWIGVASGIALFATGSGLLAAGPRRPGSRFFSLFVIVWGIEIALFNARGLAEFVRSEPIVLGTIFSLVLLETLFLVHFIVQFRGAEAGRSRRWSYGTAAFVAVVGAMLALDPSRFLQGTGFTTQASLLIFLPNFAALYVALHLLVDRYLSLSRGLELRETAIVATALSLYAGYTAGFFLSFYALEWWSLDQLDTVADGPYLVLFLGASLLLGALVVRILRRTPEPPGDGLDRWVLAGLSLPFLLGVATGAPSRLTDVRVDLFGVLRVAAALLIAYGLLKYDLFDIDLKVKRGLSRAATVSVFVFAFFIVSEGVELLISEAMGTWAGLGAAGLLALGLRPIERQADRLADRAMPRVEPSEAYLEERRAKVYQAAVERAAHDEVLTEREREILAGLREELGLREEEAQEIEQRIRSEPIAG